MDGIDAIDESAHEEMFFEIVETMKEMAPIFADKQPEPVLASLCVAAAILAVQNDVSEERLVEIVRAFYRNMESGDFPPTGRFSSPNEPHGHH